MKNNQLFDLKQTFEEIISTQEYRGIEFSYFVIKNKKIVEQQTAILEEVAKGLAMEKFEEERMSILNKYSKDESGNVVTRPAPNNRVEYVIQETHREEFEKALNELKEKYSTEIEEYTKKVQEYNKLLEQEFVPDIQFARISMERLPQNISIKHVEALFDFIDM